MLLVRKGLPESNQTGSDWINQKCRLATIFAYEGTDLCESVAPSARRKARIEAVGDVWAGAAVQSLAPRAAVLPPSNAQLAYQVRHGLTKRHGIAGNNQFPHLGVRSLPAMFRYRSGISLIYP
jgi:hypothetical protein